MTDRLLPSPKKTEDRTPGYSWIWHCNRQFAVDYCRRQIWTRRKPLQIRSYQWTADHDFLLLTGPVSITWDSVPEAPYYIYETASKKIWPLAENNPSLRNVYLSPDGKRVGYVLENNLYITELQGQSTRAITTDGSADIFNGIFDYASGSFRRDAWHWSPDGGKSPFSDSTQLK